jgi:uncharacterized protein (TIGR03435 family)
MSLLDDHELLAQYAQGKREASDAAFAALAERHVNLVYSTALRSVGNAHAAQEIAQAVFIILANKAGKLSRRVVLSGWLYQTTRLTAANFLRGEFRRQQREQEAFMQSTLQEPADDPAWRQIAPLLDEALGKLGNRDRNAILLRFFEGKSLAEVGAAAGTSEDAAKMRVNRALEKLRKIFSKRGAAFSVAAIAGAVSANSVHAAPVGLAKTISAVALVKGAAAGGSTLTLAKGTLKLMAWSKTQTAIVAGVVVLFAAGTTTVTVKEIQEHKTYPWQVPNVSSTVLRETPPQIGIARSKFPDSMDRGIVWDGNDQVLGIWQPFNEMVAVAYGRSLARIVFSGPIPSGKFDFIANLPSGNEAALQNEIRRKFGLAGKLETRNTDVLLLEIQNSHAPGLQPNDPRRLAPNTQASSRTGRGSLSYRDQSVSSLVSFLETRFKLPVIDQTGLAGFFDMDLKWDESDYQHPNLDGLQQALLDQLGLELVPTNMPIEMLVVEKANN